MCLFCEKEDIERESIEKKEKLDNVLKIADKLIKQKNIKDVRESPVYSLIRAISNLHLYDIVRELYEGEDVTDIQSIYNDVGRYLNSSVTFNNSKSFKLGKSEIDINLSKDAVLVCAWSEERFINALLKIGKNVGNKFEYKKINHDYYKVLVKEFGDTYDCLVEPSLLTELDMIYLNNFRIVIVNKIHKKRKKSGPNKKQSFFDYFAQQDKNFVLKIIEKYKEKDSNYYKVLVKEYGETYDCLVVPSCLTKKEKQQLDNFKLTIRKELQNNNLFVKSPEIQTSQNEDFNYNLSMSYIYRRFPNLKQEKDANLIILTSFIDKKKSVESISALTKFPIKKIDFILLKHLYVFSFKMPEIIEDILRRGTYTVSQIVNFNYIQTQVPFLNDKEKELLYLKMVELYQNQLSDVLKFSDKEMKYKMKTLKFENFN